MSRWAFPSLGKQISIIYNPISLTRDKTGLFNSYFYWRLWFTLYPSSCKKWCCVQTLGTPKRSKHHKLPEYGPEFWCEFLEKTGVHITAQYSGTVFGQRVWTWPKARVWGAYYNCTYRKHWKITSIQRMPKRRQSEISVQHRLLLHWLDIHLCCHNTSQMSGFVRWRSSNSPS